MERIVVAYAGGLEDSIAIPWLAEKYGAEIVAVTMDLGQGRELEAVRDRALAAGAARAHVLDVREEFARDYVLRALKAGAMCNARDPAGPALGGPLIARKLVEIAAIEQAGAVAHAGRDRVRWDVMVRALNPAITVLAPALDWGMTRPEAIEYARTRAIPVPATGSRYRIAASLWGRSIRGGVQEDPWTAPPEEMYTLTKAAEECPAEPACVEITFEHGAPTAINGVVMPFVDLIASLGTIAGAHGVGRGTFSEAPAAAVLHAAHGELQQAATTREAERFTRLVSLQYADLVDSGLWFAPLREALDAYVDKVQERVTGVVRLKLFKGDCRVVGRRSPSALLDRVLAIGSSK